MMRQSRSKNDRTWTVIAWSRYVRCLSLLSAAYLFTGCGATMEMRDGLVNSPSSISTPQPISAPATCGTFKNSTNSLSGGVTAVYTNGTLQPNFIRVRITAVDSNFNKSGSNNLQFFRWRSEQNGTVNIDRNPIRFMILRASDSTQLTGAVTALTANDITSISAFYKLGSGGIQEFFNQVVIVLTDLDLTWNAAKAVLYSGSTTLAQADMLLPTFMANPNMYAVTHPSVLTQLHPFADLRSLALSDSEWASRAKTLCF